MAKIGIIGGKLVGPNGDVSASATYLEVDQDDYTVLDDDGYRAIYVTPGASDRTVTLPTVADNDNRLITIKKIGDGAGAVIVDGEGAELVEGDASVSLCDEHAAITLHAVNGKWIGIVPDGAAYAEMYQTANSTATTINTVDVWEQVLNFSGGETCNCSVASSAMTLGVNAHGKFHVAASVSGVPDAVNQVMEFAISVNDVIATKTTQSRKFSSTTDSGSVAIVAILDLADGDVVKLEVRNTTGDSDFTVQNANVNIGKI